MKRLWQNLIRAWRQPPTAPAPPVLLRAFAFGFLSFAVGFLIGSIHGYKHGAADQARLDALVSPEGREHLRREFQQAPTNALPVVTPK